MYSSTESGTTDITLRVGIRAQYEPLPNVTLAAPLGHQHINPANLASGTSTPAVATLTPPKEIWGLSIESFSYVMLIVGVAAPLVFLIIVFISIKCHAYRKRKRLRATGNAVYGFSRGNNRHGMDYQKQPPKDFYHYGGGDLRRSVTGYQGGSAPGRGVYSSSVHNGHVMNGHRQSDIRRQYSMKGTYDHSYGIRAYGEPAYGEPVYADQEGYRMSNNNPNVYFGTINGQRVGTQNSTRPDLNNISYSPTGHSVQAGHRGQTSPKSPLPSVSGRSLQHSTSITSQERHALAAFDSIYEGMDVSGSTGAGTYDLVYDNGGIHPMPGIAPQPRQYYAGHQVRSVQSSPTKDSSIQTSNHHIPSQRGPFTGDVYAVPQRKTLVSMGTQTSIENRDDTHLPLPPPPEELLSHGVDHQVSSGAVLNSVSPLPSSSGLLNNSVAPETDSDTSQSNTSYNLLTHSTPTPSNGTHSNGTSITETNGVIYETSPKGIATHQITIHNLTLQSESTIKNSTTTHTDATYGRSSPRDRPGEVSSPYTSATSLSIDSDATRDVRQDVTATVHTSSRDRDVDDEEQLYIMAGVRPPSPYTVDNVAYVAD